jgi:outer membrane lipoprotein-sorting protein
MRHTLQKAVSILLVACFLALLVACGGSQKATKQPARAATPFSGQGQQLLTQSAQLLNTAQSLHGVFNGSISGKLVNGEVDSEIWRMAPNKNRTLILKSTLSQFAAGTLIVNDGKQVWQFDPAKNVVYTGQPGSTSLTGKSVLGMSQGNEQQLLLDVVQMIFTDSTGTLLSSSEKVNGRPVYVIHVDPRSQSSATPGFSYDGTVSLDQQSHLPVALALTMAGIGQVQITIPSLTLNQPLAASLFAFIPPPGVPQEPFPTTPMGTSSSLTLQQAEQQAGYHLLSIPTSQSAYTLQSIDALGAPGNQIYALTYIFNGQNFTISQSKALANLPLSGSNLSLRNTTAMLSSSGNTSTLSWTEKGVGIQITGPLSKDQILAIANLLT